MKEFKGTPGPWQWTEDMRDEGNALLGANGAYVFYGDNICEGLSNDDGWAARIGGTHSDEESEANARLIAAAPELLEALQSVIAEKAPVYHDCLDNGEAECIWCVARTVIAKALGETK